MAIGNSTVQYFYTSRGPLDAKALVQNFEALTKEATWLNDSGEIVAYNGMLTAVWLDKVNSALSDKNGIYFLFDPEVTSTRGTTAIPDVTKVENWHKLGELKDLDGLAEQINAMRAELDAVKENIEDLQDSATVVKENRSDFPAEGTPGKLYVATAEAKTYVWVNNNYLPVGDGTGDSTPDIQIICGGNATA